MLIVIGWLFLETCEHLEDEDDSGISWPTTSAGTTCTQKCPTGTTGSV